MRALRMGSGSSPLSRGILGLVSVMGDVARIIPALAGNTPHRLHILLPRWDHPRSRGEYFSSPEKVSRIFGSSPLSRGIHLSSPETSLRARIIPALAGNTEELAQILGVKPDHPRSRGEYVGDQVVAEVEVGSSPLSRGILYPHFYADLPSRIIPALAGNTG